MKIFIRCLIVSLITLLPYLQEFTHAQPSDSFFPSQVGNLWQYQDDGGNLWTVQFTRDSLAVDGNVFLFYDDQPEPRYRIDTSASVYEWPLSYNDHLYKLDADSGEAWVWFNNGFVNWYGWVARIYSSVVFGRLTTVKVIRLGPNHPDSCGDTCFWYWERHLASGFGVIYAWEEPFYVSFLRGCVIAGDTFGTIVSVEPDQRLLPTEISLNQNYPNPFNATTMIEFSLTSEMNINLGIYDIIGRQLMILVDERRRSGRHSVIIHGSNLPSGIYIVRMVANDQMLSRKITLMK